MSREDFGSRLRNDFNLLLKWTEKYKALNYALSVGTKIKPFVTPTVF